MYSQELKDRFICMKAAGMSFDKISGILDISKPTLIKWWFAFKKKIALIEYSNALELMEKYCLGRKAQLEEALSMLARINVAIKETDLSKVNITTQLEMRRLFEEKVAARIAELETNAEITAIGIDKDVILSCNEDAAARAEGAIENLLDKYKDGVREINRKFRNTPPDGVNPSSSPFPRPENGEERTDSSTAA